jgi:transcriptional regulator with XRE-family HTH domain
MSNPEIVRMLAVLRDAIRLARFTNREVERRLGWSSGYLSRLFAGLMELRVEHVLNICSVIAFPPNEFFRAVYPDGEDEAAGGSKLRQALERLHPEPGYEPKKATPPPPPKVEAPNEQEIQRMLLIALRKLLQEGTTEAKASGE